MALARVLIFVIVFFISTGIYLYDQHLTRQGKVGPVTQLMDFVHYGKYALGGDRSSRARGDDQAVNINEHLTRLGETYDALCEERAELQKKRNEILRQLSELNGQLVEEAQGYAEVLTQERYQFLEEFPAMKAVALQMAQVQTETDPVERKKKLLEIEQQLNALMKEAAGETTRDSTRAAVLFVLNRVAEEHPEEFLNICGDLDAEACWESNAAQAGDLLFELFDVESSELADDVKELKDIVENLGREYYIYAENYEASEQLLEEGNERAQGELQRLSQKLVETTDVSVEEIRKLYEDLFFEYDVVLENLAFNLKRLEERQDMLNWHVNRLSDHERADQEEKAEKTLSAFEAIRRKQQELFRLLVKDFAALKDTYRRQRALAEGLSVFIQTSQLETGWVRTSGQGNIQVEKNKETLRQAFSNRQSKTAEVNQGRSYTQVTNNRPSQSHTSVSPSRPGTRTSATSSSLMTQDLLRQNAARNSDIADRSKEQMQRLRDKARDQGFYDRSFPSNP